MFFQEKADRQSRLPSSNVSSVAPNTFIAGIWGNSIIVRTGADLDARCRDDILGLKLDDFHLSLGVLFHVYTPPFAENLYVKQLLYRVTRKKIL